jgi:hypothetical protein
MLYVLSRVSNQRVEADARLELMNRLQEKGLVPLIRSTRLSCYDTALLGPEHAGDMERIVSAWTNAEGDAPYINGDVFCSEDFALFSFSTMRRTTKRECARALSMKRRRRSLSVSSKLCRNVSNALQWKTGASTDDDDETGMLDRRLPPSGICAFRLRKKMRRLPLTDSPPRSGTTTLLRQRRRTASTNYPQSKMRALLNY